MTYSATNDFVNRMTNAPFAVILGDKTGGGGGMPLSSEIPNGWMVRVPTSPMFNANMQHIEWGIDPDISIALKTEDAAKGYDTLIDSAVALIKFF
jgi:C-terminal processing protease CtpA/Prc